MPPRLSAFLAACSLSAVLHAGPRRPTVVFVDYDLEFNVGTQEKNIPRIERLLELVELKPKMTVLDIGAGTGQQSYKMAERLKGTGKVYAADVEPQLVEYIAAQAKRRGLSNLEPVLVKPDGVDEFYGKHRYDLVLLYDVLSYIYDQVNYLRQIGDRLSPGGRVVLVANEGHYLSFYPEDVKDWDGFAADLRKEPPSSPFGRELRRPLQGMLDAYPRGAETFKRAAVFQLNRLSEGEFFEEFAEGLEFRPGVSFSEEEKPFAAWILRRVRSAGLAKGFSNMSARSFEAVRRLNKLLMIQKFRRRLEKNGYAPYLSSAPESRWMIEYDAQRRIFEKAGYRLERKAELPPFQAVWIFARP